jgi:hypothetical protein
MKANAPADTGDLRNSISAAVEEGNARAIYFTMLDYGYFQNYGVSAGEKAIAKPGKELRVGLPVEEAILGIPNIRPTNGVNYKFGVRMEKHPGIEAIGFFSMAELERKLREGLGRDTTAFIRNNI